VDSSGPSALEMYQRSARRRVSGSTRTARHVGQAGIMLQRCTGGKTWRTRKHFDDCAGGAPIANTDVHLHEYRGAIRGTRRALSSDRVSGVSQRMAARS